ncbi:Rieske (2Fe-2S) protein [Haloarcula litorea]|uniref:Rieske (2Fe-2S) protein n=1 Tax=Haloarcula litorea TaxID=3032579 RepID=UPI0023E8E5A7|nr:Rieske (2Fe-2S) protein [Halomicroarcula sp. GDY20]
MTDSVRVTVEDGEDETSVRVHDDEGTVEAGEASLSFSVAGTGDDTDEPDESGDADRIVALDEVPRDGTLRCEARSGARGTEFILHHDGDAVVAWRNSCPHQPEVPLDRGDGAIVRRDRIVCHKHGAQFEPEGGVCTHGPCAGDALDSIAVEVRDGAVYLADDRYDGATVL